MFLRLIVIPVLCATLFLSLGVVGSGLWLDTAYGSGCNKSSGGYVNNCGAAPACPGSCTWSSSGAGAGPGCGLLGQGCGCQ